MVFSNDNKDGMEIDNLFEMIIDLYNALMKTFPDLVVILDLEGIIINISRNIQNFYATKSIEDFIGKNIIDFVVSEDREPFKEDLEKAINQGFLKMVEYNFFGANDSRFVGELSLSLIKNKKNEPNFFIGIIRDITNQKGIESELRENKQMFQLIIDNIPQLISWKDINSTYMGCNTNFAKVAGLSTPEEIINKTDYELPWKVSEAESFFEIDQLVMDTNKPEYHIILPQLQADGKEAWLDANKVPLHDINKKVVGLLCTYEDITERIKTEKILKKSEKKYKDAYNRAEFYKDVFAHDVNNILQGILSSIELCKLSLKNTQTQLSLEELYDMIEDQVNRGAKLVSNIRKISSIDDIENTITPINVCNLIDISLENIRKMFPKKQIVSQCITESDEIYIKANSLLQDVIENILHNAVKHNRNSIIEIQVNVLKEVQDKMNYIRLEFIDNGLGIPDAQKFTIFRRGTLEHSSFNRLGLGLSLVRKLVESYQGKIWVEDKVKGNHTKGSKFIVMIKEA
ncbi:Adaptive-response sensory-kinase SasA [subsurface metagenome]